MLRGPFSVLAVRSGLLLGVYALLRVLFVLLNAGSFADCLLYTSPSPRD